MRPLLYGAFVLLLVLHNDLWLWEDGRIVLGLPIGLAYHIAYAVAASALMALLVRFAWPSRVDVEEDGEDRS
jgi:hypothetical protein